MAPIEIKYNRYTYLIPIPFCLLLMWLFYQFVLNEPQEEIQDKNFIYVAIGAIAVGAFLTLNFAWRFIKAPVVFRMDDEGILYNPAGVTTGLIRWDEIDNAEEVQITTYNNGTAIVGVLAISLKDPEAYRRRYNILFQKALELGEKRYHASVLIEPAVLGKNYETVKTELKRRTNSFSLK